MRDRRGFLRHSIRVRVEGFEQERLLTECLQKGIPIKDIHLVSDIEMTLTLMEWDYEKFLKIVRSRYQITIIRESGYKPAIRNTFSKKSTAAGLILFVLLMFYQSTFVSEIRINGYEKFTESQIRESLRGGRIIRGLQQEGRS